MKISFFLIILGLCGSLVGCGPSKAEQRALLEQQERDDRAAKAANQAITDMNQKMFKSMTPEERAKRDEENKRLVQELLDAQKKADADAAAKTAP